MPVPHSLSVDASTRSFGLVDLSMDMIVVHSFNSVTQMFSFEGGFTFQHKVSGITVPEHEILLVLDPLFCTMECLIVDCEQTRMEIAAGG